MRRLTALALLLGLAATGAAATARSASPARSEIVHPGAGHDVHVSSAAVAAGAEGRPVVAWIAREGHDTHLYVARPGADGHRVRVNPEGLAVDALHLAPGLAVGPGGEVYVTWSSAKPKPVGTLFASDLRLSRSLDGGRTFEAPLRVNEDRPLSHSFEGLAVAADGTVLVGWIDSREGPQAPATFLAQVVERGTRVERVTRLDGDTCVCCRVAVATGPRDVIAVAWRKVFPGDLRDMVAGLSRDGGRTFAAPALVHGDRWKITACPHRGGTAALDGAGRLHVAWYTEGTGGQPRLSYAVAPDGRRFGPPRTVHAAGGSIPDHLRMAVNARGEALLVWEDATAVRRRVVMRRAAAGGGALGAPRVLSDALKAFAPDVAVTPSGDFVVVWHEERFPTLRTVTLPVAGAAAP